MKPGRLALRPTRDVLGATLGTGLLGLALAAWLSPGLFLADGVRAEGDVTMTVDLFGSVVSRDSEGYFSAIQGGAAKVLWLVEEGSAVRAGEEICRIDSYEVERLLRVDESRLGELREELVSAEEEGDSRRILDEAELRALQEEVRVAESELGRLERLGLPVKEAELRSEVEMAEQNALEAARKLEVVDEFFGRGFASTAEREAARHDRQVQVGRLERARQQERSFLEGGREAERAKKSVEVARLRAKLIDIQQRRERAGPRGEQKLGNLRAAVARATTQVDDLRRQVEGSTIRARAAGTVVYGEVKDQSGVRRQLQVGDLVWSNVVLLRVSDLSKQDFLARVPEQRARVLERAQRAGVRLSADPGHRIEAVLRRVGSVSADAESGVRSLEVKLELERTPSWVRPGMTGRAQIEIDIPAGAMVLPNEAIRVDGDRTYVLEKTWWWRERERDVRVLAETPEGVALEGLEPGARVLLPDPEP